MIELIETNWPLFVAALLIGIIVAWWVLVANRRTKVSGKQGDVLDEGADPAARNQALIDAPPASAAQAPQAPGMAGAGSAVAAAAQEQAAKASEELAEADGDDLTRIKGVGPKLRDLLYSLGVRQFGQIAAWSDEDIDRIDAQLGRFEGRIRRDSWVEQAALLAADDTSGYEKKFGKL